MTEFHTGLIIGISIGAIISIIALSTTIFCVIKETIRIKKESISLLNEYNELKENYNRLIKDIERNKRPGA